MVCKEGATLFLSRLSTGSFVQCVDHERETGGGMDD